MKNGTSSRASALLRKASPAFEPSSADRKHTRAAIRRRIAVGIAASAAVSSATKTAAAAPSMAPAAVVGGGGVAAAGGASIGIATKIVAAVAIVGSVSAGAVTVHRASVNRAAQTQPQTQVVAPQVAPQIETKKVDTTSKIDIAPPIPIPEVVEPAPAVVEASPSIVDHRPTITASTPPSTIDSRPSTPSLQTGAEVDLLRRAQEAMNDGNANAALALLDEHARKYPNGSMTEDFEAARVVALCDANRVDDARATAKSFSIAHPASPFAARIAASCAGTGSSEP